jgi:SIR2-like domain
MAFASDPLTQLAFAVHENKGIYALVLGSGLSRAAGIPTGWEITLDLIRCVAMARGFEEQPDWAAWYRKEAGKQPNYSTVLAELALSPAERRSILHGYIEPTETDRQEGRKIPTAAHRAIAELVRRGYIRVIVTTNFDRLTDNALRDAGIEPTVIASADALSGAEPITHSACYILKLHGDYKDSRILNTDEELQDYPDEYNRLLDRIFDEYGLIVCGWSGEWDHALRAAFLRAPNRRYSMYWANCARRRKRSSIIARRVC